MGQDGKRSTDSWPERLYKEDAFAWPIRGRAAAAHATRPGVPWNGLAKTPLQTMPPAKMWVQPD